MVEKLYQAAEVAALLGLARETVYRKVKSGEIPAIRIGGRLRFPASQLEQWMTAKREEQPERWRHHLGRFVALLRESFGHGLKSVVLFGSFAAGRETTKSDLDLLIVCDTFPKSRLMRQGLLFEWAKKISPAFAHKLSPLPLTPEEARLPRPLYLGVLPAYEILYDEGNFFQLLLNEFRVELASSNARKQFDEEGRAYWVFPMERTT